MVSCDHPTATCGHYIFQILAPPLNIDGSTQIKHAFKLFCCCVIEWPDQSQHSHSITSRICCCNKWVSRNTLRRRWQYAVNSQIFSSACKYLISKTIRNFIRASLKREQDRFEPIRSSAISSVFCSRVIFTYWHSVNHPTAIRKFYDTTMYSKETMTW